MNKYKANLMDFKIKRICQICGEEIGLYVPSIHPKTCSPECLKKLRSMQTSGYNNPNYRNGKNFLNHYCIDCGKLIDKSGRSIRCHRCRIIAFPALPNGHNQAAKIKIGEKSKTKFTAEYRKKTRDKYEKLGIWLPLNQINPYKLYCRQSNWIERMFNYGSEKELNLLKEFGVFSSKNTKGVVRDHKYSRYSGFKHQINPIILRHPANCEIILHKDNVKKAKTKHRYKDGDSMTLEDLFSSILNFTKQWKEQQQCVDAVKKHLNEKKEVALIGGVSV
jgi:hypothetical protein